MSKVKCGVCANEHGGICSIKRVGVKTNKSRLCEAYIYDERKLKTKQEVTTIKFGYKEQQEEKKKRKEEVDNIKQQYNSNHRAKIDMIKQSNPNSKYPLTGDLSRFITTATRKGD